MGGPDGCLALLSPAPCIHAAAHVATYTRSSVGLPKANGGNNLSFLRPPAGAAVTSLPAAERGTDKAQAVLCGQPVTLQQALCEAQRTAAGAIISRL